MRYKARVNHLVESKEVEDGYGGKKRAGGYGFLEVEGYEKHIFFNAKDVKAQAFPNLAKGDIVGVDRIEETPKGLVARGVEVDEQ